MASTNNYTVAATTSVLQTSTLTLATNGSGPEQSTYGPFSREYFAQLTDEELRNYVYQHQLPGKPGTVAAVSIMSLSVMVFICSTLVLVITRYTSGGQSATLVFLRSLLVSDMLMALHGLGKMGLLLNLRQLRVNFFLPDSLFFTASLASTASLLSLNLDCFLKLTRPLKYAQVDKHTVISVMLLIWNVAFVVGFLPLVGWYQEPYTFRFFSFFPWHFLLFNALVVLLCALVCVGCMVSLKRFRAPIPDPDPACFHARSLEVRKYRHLHRTILMESCMWLAAYLPFFLYISVTCRQCPAGAFRYSDAHILYFIPVFLVKSLVSAGLQAFRTVRVHAIMNKLITDISHIASPPRNRKQNHEKQRKGLATISYTNPLCEQQQRHDDENENERQSEDDNESEDNHHNHKRYRMVSSEYELSHRGIENPMMMATDSSSSDEGGLALDNLAQQLSAKQQRRLRDAHHHCHHHHRHDHHQHHQSRTLLLDHDEWLQRQHALQDATELTDFTSLGSDQDQHHHAFSRHGSSTTSSTIVGITNLAFRPSLQFDVEGSTKL